MSDCHDCDGCAVAVAPPPLHKGARTHVVAIIGPPNSGKSTLFNRLTGLRQKVANFPGVTVEQRVGQSQDERWNQPSRRGPGRSPRRLQPESALGRRTGHARRPVGSHARHPQARRSAVDSGLHQPRPPSGAGRSDSQPEAADAGHPQYGRRSKEPRRPRGHGRARQ